MSIDPVLEGDVFATASNGDPRAALIQMKAGIQDPPLVRGEITITPDVIRFETAPGPGSAKAILLGEKKRLQLARRVIEKAGQSRVDLTVRTTS
jgi:hypothetical protein